MSISEQSGAPPAVLNLGTDGLEELTVRTRSKYKEFSYDAKKNSPNSLFGKVHFTNGATQISVVEQHSRNKFQRMMFSQLLLKKFPLLLLILMFH